MIIPYRDLEPNYSANNLCPRQLLQYKFQFFYSCFFKIVLKCSYVPEYLYLGERKLNTLHTKRGYMWSDLFRVNLFENAYCEFGNVEYAFHFFYSYRLTLPKLPRIGRPKNFHRHLLVTIMSYSVSRIECGESNRGDSANSYILINEFGQPIFNSFRYTSQHVLFRLCVDKPYEHSTVAGAETGSCIFLIHLPYLLHVK